MEKETICTDVESSQNVDKLAAVIASEARAVEYVYLQGVNSNHWTLREGFLPVSNAANPSHIVMHECFHGIDHCGPSGE